LKGKIKAKIIGTGSYLPSKILSNQDLEKIVDTSDEWITSRTGIKERRIASDKEFTSSMAINAAKKAIEKSRLAVEEIDFIIVSTLTPDYIFPSTACLIQNELGCKNAAAIDIQAACTGYIYGLSIAKSLIQSGSYKNVLLIASEKLSSIVNYEDRSTCVLFGDGAAAAIISSCNKSGLSIESVCLGADGEQAKLLVLPAGGCKKPASIETVENKEHFIQMAGNEVFKHAVRRMESASKECLEKVGLLEENVSWLIPHQANNRIIDAIAKRFVHLSNDRIYKTVHKYGNTSASSIGIALDELMHECAVIENENILLTAFGSGFTWGASLLRYEEEKK
jgi:3-oxoacyl-[acyl-carrier-protein] synthase III